MTVNVKEGYIKKHIMTKVGDALMGNNQPRSLSDDIRNSTITYTPTPTHLIKKEYLHDVEGDSVVTQRVSYQEFNEHTRIVDSLNISKLPTDCYRVEEFSDKYVYYANFGTLIIKMFQRRYFSIGAYQQQELIAEPAYRERVTVEFDVSKDERELLAVRIYTDGDKRNRCAALEERTMRLASRIRSSDKYWLSTLSYWMKSITEDEPNLLQHVKQGLSLKDYQGEEG